MLFSDALERLTDTQFTLNEYHMPQIKSWCPSRTTTLFLYVDKTLVTLQTRWGDDDSEHYSTPQEVFLTTQSCFLYFPTCSKITLALQVGNVTMLFCSLSGCICSFLYQPLLGIIFFAGAKMNRESCVN